jgi:cell division protein DivIC
MLSSYQIPRWIKNKYFLTLIGFAVWMLFVDDRDVFTTYFTQRQELKIIQKNKLYFESEIATTLLEIKQLKNNPATIEQYAREKYFMKKPNEDLFIVVENPDKK